MGRRMLMALAIGWMIIVVASVSSSITLVISGVTPRASADASGAISVSAKEYETIERYARLEEVRRIMESDFYREVPDELLVEGAIRGMLDSVEDVYTFYYTPEEKLEQSQHTEGVYQGIGVILTGDKNGMLTIVRVFRDSPSEKAGILSGDKIIAVDGQIVSGETSKHIDEAIALVKQADKFVTLTIHNENGNRDVKVDLAPVKINRVDYEMLTDEVGYVAIYEFMGDDVTGFNKALEEFNAKGAKGIIIDLRSNPGGLLNDVVAIADKLLPKGLIVYMEDRYGKREDFFSDDKRIDLPMVVLVNEMSASASEVLTGALKDYGVATIVGEKTFGKGIVQTVIDFPKDGAGMQLTTARYFTPSGKCIHEIGIEPDIEVALSADYDASISRADMVNDNQLKVAFDELMKKISP